MGKQCDLVFEGGGVKGIGLAGAFFELWKQGYEPQCVAGTSAGAITAALVAAGYDGQELKELVLKGMHFPLFEDRPRFHLLGTAAGEVVEVLRDRGLHSGNYFHEWIAGLLEKKDKKTFADLRNPDPHAAGTNREYTLQVIASDLTDHSMLVLPRDAQAKLGIAPDELAVADAVRMSMSIPVFFDPVIATNPDDGRRHMIVDGGLLSNYPVWLFDAEEGKPRFATFGLLLVAGSQKAPLLPEPPAPAARHGDGLLSPIGYVRAVVETMMQAHDRFYVEQENYVRTIPIDTCGVTTTDFQISEAKASELFESGRNAAAGFLKTWNFDDYVASFRSGSAPGRRDGVVAQAKRSAAGDVAS
jgi:NTE family protein